MQKKKIAVTVSKNYEWSICAEDSTAHIKLGVYPTGVDEIYIITDNGTWISIDTSGRVRIDIPPK